MLLDALEEEQCLSNAPKSNLHRARDTTMARQLFSGVLANRTQCEMGHR
jgi:hypothetical protein